VRAALRAALRVKLLHSVGLLQLVYHNHEVRDAFKDAGKGADRLAQLVEVPHSPKGSFDHVLDVRPDRGNRRQADALAAEAGALLSAPLEGVRHANPKSE